MRKFRFPLSRVLEWRRTQLRMEEVKLERAHAEVRKIQRQIEDVRSRRTAAEQALIASGSATGMELAVLADFKEFIANESTRLTQIATEAGKRAAAQMNAAAESSR